MTYFEGRAKRLRQYRIDFYTMAELLQSSFDCEVYVHNSVTSPNNYSDCFLMNVFRERDGILEMVRISIEQLPYRLRACKPIKPSKREGSSVTILTHSLSSNSIPECHDVKFIKSFVLQSMSPYWDKTKEHCLSSGSYVPYISQFKQLLLEYKE